MATLAGNGLKDLINYVLRRRSICDVVYLIKVRMFFLARINCLKVYKRRTFRHY